MSVSIKLYYEIEHSLYFDSSKNKSSILFLARGHCECQRRIPETDEAGFSRAFTRCERAIAHRLQSFPVSQRTGKEIIELAAILVLLGQLINCVLR